MLLSILGDHVEELDGELVLTATGRRITRAWSGPGFVHRMLATEMNGMPSSSRSCAAAETIDFMTALWAHLPYEPQDECSRRRELGGGWLVYDISGKSPAPIERE